MKTFRILMQGGEDVYIEAESYRREGEQYVFDGTASGEVVFVKEQDVRGITVEPAGPDVVGGRGWG